MPIAHLAAARSLPVAILAHHTSGTIERLHTTIDGGMALATFSVLALAVLGTLGIATPRLFRRLAERVRVGRPRRAGS